MPLPNLPVLASDAFHVRFTFNMPGGAGLAQTHMDFVPTVALLGTVSENLQEFSLLPGTGIIDALQDVIPTDASILEVFVASLKYPFLVPGVSAPNQPGNELSDCLPSCNQATIQIRTHVNNKRGRGRMQMPCVPETFQTDNLLNVSGIGKYESLIDTMEVGVTTVLHASDWHIAVVQRISQNLVTGDWTLGYSPATSINIRPLIGTQRRRLFGRGQ